MRCMQPWFQRLFLDRGVARAHRGAAYMLWSPFGYVLSCICGTSGPPRKTTVMTSVWSRYQMPDRGQRPRRAHARHLNRHELLTALYRRALSGRQSRRGLVYHEEVLGHGHHRRGLWYCGIMCRCYYFRTRASGGLAPVLKSARKLCYLCSGCRPSNNAWSRARERCSHRRRATTRAGSCPRLHDDLRFLVMFGDAVN